MSAPSRACRTSLTLSAALSRLDLSGTRATVLAFPRHTPIIQSRHESTLRRQRKKWNIPPAPVLPEDRAATRPTASSGRSHRPRAALPAGDTIVFNPPSSSPNVYHTPAIFLPKDDPRRQLQLQRAAKATATAPSASSALSEATESQLPPIIRGARVKSYHLGPAEIEEMRALRKQDEKTWTQQALAQKFNCGKAFVGMVVPASSERRAELAKHLDMWKKVVWGPRRRKARLDRQKRRELWKYD